MKFRDISKLKPGCKVATGWCLTTVVKVFVDEKTAYILCSNNQWYTHRGIDLYWSPNDKV